MIKTIKAFTSLGLIIGLASCGNSSHAPYSTPSVPIYRSSSVGSLNKSSVSNATRTVVKTGSINLDLNNVREGGENIEQIITSQGGHILSYNERDDKKKNSSFSARVPAKNLVSTMDQISELGKVSYRRIEVEDRTKEAIAQKAHLAKLKQRRTRLKAIYRNAKELKDKLEIEKSLADIEERIFSIEEGIRQMKSFSNFSKLDISLSQKTIRGPIGATFDGFAWSFGKLFTIRK